MILKFIIGVLEIYIFHPINSFLGFIHTFSFVGILILAISVILISYKIYQNKVSSGKILMLIFIITINQFEDYLFSNAFQISILSFIILGKLLKSNKLIKN